MPENRLSVIPDNEEHDDSYFRNLDKPPDKSMGDTLGKSEFGVSGTG